MANRKKINTNLTIILSAAIITLMGQIAYTYATSFVVIALGVTAIFSFIMRQEDLVPFLLILLPANRLLTLGPISAPTVLMMVAIFRKGKAVFRLPKGVFLGSSCLLSYSIFSFFSDEVVFFDAVKIVVMLLFWYLYERNQDISKSYRRYIVFAAIGCVLSSFIVLLINPSSLIESSRFTFSKNGENVLGILCAIVAINLLVIIMENKRERNFFYIIMMAAVLGIGFFTGSRSFLLAIAIGIAGIVIMMVLKLQLKGLLKIGLIILIVSLGAIVLVKNSLVINNYLNSIIYRITKLQTTDVSNGRYGLWEQYFTLFKNNPKYLWFGGFCVGTQGILLVAHNMIIEQIASYGIVGTVIIVFLFVAIIKEMLFSTGYRFKFYSYRIIPLIAFLGVSMVSHTILGVPQTTMLFLCLFAILEKNRGLNGGIE